MAISGKNFLHVNSSNLVITDHALLRINQHAHLRLSRSEARRCFNTARQRRHGELALSGFHPNYLGRRELGIQSWYFDLKAGDSMLLAVVQQKDGGENLVWVTTYPPEAENDNGQGRSGRFRPN